VKWPRRCRGHYSSVSLALVEEVTDDVLDEDDDEVILCDAHL
jgi:hypothetical protein